MKKIIPRMLGHYLNTMAVVSPRTAGRKGFELFCRPFRTPLKGHHKEFLHSAERSFFHYENESVRVYKWGSGAKKLLFLHGWQSHSFRWKNYIESLSTKDYTIYALDAPGHGLSSGKFLTVPLYSTIIEKFILELDEVDTIVSHSIGAFSTMYTLHRLPLLPVKKLVLMASPGEGSEFIQFYKQALQLSDKCIGLVLEHFEKVIEYPLDYFSVSNFAGSLKRPGLIIHDEDDDETPYAHSVRIHKLWPQSKLLLTKGFGHNLRSPLVVKEVKNFILEKVTESASLEKV